GCVWQRILGHDRVQLLGGGHDDARGEVELLFDRRLDRRRDPLRAGARGPEDRVAAVEQGAHVRVAKSFDQRSKIGHRDAVRAADVDATEERDAGRHEGWGPADGTRVAWIATGARLLTSGW